MRCHRMIGTLRASRTRLIAVTLPKMDSAELLAQANTTAENEQTTPAQQKLSDSVSVKIVEHTSTAKENRRKPIHRTGFAGICAGILHERKPWQKNCSTRGDVRSTDSQSDGAGICT